ncbi:hypothetical protein [Aurantiacibacter sp. D1-12]|uniref:hypothetical protein n=1 Tax=Aurantiacibacter sp. D1-12 TaxID=2993658 RepID=UPI00237C6407|nr:hypothetical protein [Aurantiacibacter sp. D1-12]MDE1466796.1 hypothetical protein [Aurantiacibacter sp. D1-12]
MNDLGLPTGFFRRSEIEAVIRDNFENYLAPYDLTGVVNLDALAEELFEKLLASDVLIEQTEKFAGTYFKVDDKKVQPFRSAALQESQAYKAKSRIGQRFYTDVFAGYRTQIELPVSLESAKDDLNPLAGIQKSEVDWETVSKSIDAEKHEDIRARISELIPAIQQSELSERQKKNAIAHAEAISKLVEAPDPPWEVIVDLLNNRYFSAILNAMAILQLILGGL